jgi:hypothetical protein
MDFPSSPIVLTQSYRERVLQIAIRNCGMEMLPVFPVVSVQTSWRILRSVQKSLWLNFPDCSGGAGNVPHFHCSLVFAVQVMKITEDIRWVIRKANSVMRQPSAGTSCYTTGFPTLVQIWLTNWYIRWGRHWHWRYEGHFLKFWAKLRRLSLFECVIERVRQLLNVWRL